MKSFLAKLGTVVLLVLLILALALIVLLFAGTGRASQLARGLTGSSSPISELLFPNLAAEEQARQGIFVSEAELRRLVLGMTRRQVLALLGPPQFSDGLPEPREWSYVIKPSPRAPVAEACRARIWFDKENRSTGIAFQPAGCAPMARDDVREGVAAARRRGACDSPHVDVRMPATEHASGAMSGSQGHRQSAFVYRARAGAPVRPDTLHAAPMGPHGDTHQNWPSWFAVRRAPSTTPQPLAQVETAAADHGGQGVAEQERGMK